MCAGSTRSANASSSGIAGSCPSMPQGSTWLEPDVLRSAAVEISAPKRTDHDAGIDVLIRPPTLFEVVGGQAGIGRLQRFSYGHQEPRRFRLVGLGMKVEESSNHVE